jgi:hypothetical protein
MERNVYKNLSIDGVLTDLIAEDGVITFLGKTEEEGYDCKGLTARAGLFDIHIHGLVGEDANGGDIDKMSLALAKEGVTSWLPTLSPSTFDSLEAACANDSRVGAKVRGFHLEGPFVNLAKKGALKEECIVAPTVELLDRCPRATYMTIAPEVEGALDFIKEGIACRDADTVARDIINNAGYEGRFGHSLGHGVGMYIHESPRLSQGVKNDVLLTRGHVVTIEPGIYIEGLYGCRIEDMVAITSDGVRNFTKSDKKLIEIY